MAMVSPSILSADFVNLERDLRAIARSGADYIHVDVMDGLFVPNLTIGMPVVQAIARVSQLPLDVHLMIDRPIRYVDGFCQAGASILAVHLESDTPEGIRAALERTRALGVRPALALKPGTPAEAALPYLELCDMILVMTVEPGFSGQAFMADMMPKLQTIHHWILHPGSGRRCGSRHLPDLSGSWRRPAGGRLGLFSRPGPGCLCEAAPGRPEGAALKPHRP